jgi:EAL domain-containing protein (putative c-di-GMP-specific phosphodiesterase class I)
VCNAACELLSECIENGAATLLSLNISTRLLARGDFICKFTAIVDKWKLPRKLLSLELRESALVDSVNTIQARVYELVNLGFLVSIDDFGTANANFNILQTLPLTEIKVHKKFIANLASSTSDRLAVKHFCYLARSLRLNVVASGVENEEQLSHAKQCGCIAFQGYFLDKPMGVSKWKDKFQFSTPQ